MSTTPFYNLDLFSVVNYSLLVISLNPDYVPDNHKIPMEPFYMNHLMGKLCLLSLLFLSVSIYVSPALCREVKIEVPSETASQSEKSTFSLGQWLVSIYSNHISAVDADRCPSSPSCSSFCEKAIKKHGFFIGWMMTVDRLIHEGSEETEVSPMIFSDGKWMIYDPVENNDFWWYPKERKNND
jgi:putative component of membrane protein insertase Oxa1/YidC/SpoIIIJ protein YidD